MIASDSLQLVVFTGIGYAIPAAGQLILPPAQNLAMLVIFARSSIALGKRKAGWMSTTPPVEPGTGAGEGLAALDVRGPDAGEALGVEARQAVRGALGCSREVF
jgi:hypothetical protein